MFISGYKFTLEEHPRKDMNTDYVLTEIQHTAMTDSYGSSTISARGTLFKHLHVHSFFSSFPPFARHAAAHGKRTSDRGGRGPQW